MSSDKEKRLKNKFIMETKFRVRGITKDKYPNLYNAINKRLRLSVDDVNGETLKETDPVEDYLNSSQMFSNYRPQPLSNSIGGKERHIPGYNFCGPGTQVEERLKRGDYGVNELDNACRFHDVEYMIANDDKNALMESDLILSDIASYVKDKVDEKINNKKSKFTKMLSFFKIPNILTDSMTSLEDSKDKYSALAVNKVFKGKGFLEKIGIINPVNFAKKLNDKNTTQEEVIKKGSELYKNYLRS